MKLTKLGNWVTLPGFPIQFGSSLGGAANVAGRSVPFSVFGLSDPDLADPRQSAGGLAKVSRAPKINKMKDLESLLPTD